MKTNQIIKELRDLLARYTGDEKELLEALDSEAEGWRMRLRELEAEEEDDWGSLNFYMGR